MLSLRQRNIYVHHASILDPQHGVQNLSKHIDNNSSHVIQVVYIQNFHIIIIIMQLRKKTLTYVAYHSMILYLRSHLSSHQYCRELTVPLNTRTQNVILFFFFSLTISLQPYKRQPLRNFVKIICNHEIYNHCRLFFKQYASMQSTTNSTFHQTIFKHAIYIH